jgi:hypothetical protein
MLAVRCSDGHKSFYIAKVPRSIHLEQYDGREASRPAVTMAWLLMLLPSFPRSILFYCFQRRRRPQHIFPHWFPVFYAGQQTAT